MTRPVVMTIAGSDPSGGAGVQADLRTFAAWNVTGVSVVTALTVQNTQGVEASYLLEADVIGAQLEAILRETKPQAVKIGMLGGARQVRVVADALRWYETPNVVLDPVLASTGGVPLLDEEGRAALIEELAPLCRVVMPNQDEWRLLPGLGVRDVLLKGGHLEGQPVDTLIYAAGGSREFAGERINTPHTHGTGCFLSSAVAAGLAMGLALEEAIGEAKRRLTEALRHPVCVGDGRGYPDAFGIAPSTGHAQRVEKVRGIYVLTDMHAGPGRGPEDIARAALAGGASVIQLRAKEMGTLEAIALARMLTEMARAANAILIVNDRVDVALAADADGVHLGPDDMHPCDARRLLGTDKLIGVSTGTVDEARAAVPWASYLGVGAVFGTSTKADAGPAVGVERIAAIRAACPGTPIAAIGGINTENIGAVAQAGANAAGVVSAVSLAADMTAATALLSSRFADNTNPDASGIADRAD